MTGYRCDCGYGDFGDRFLERVVGVRGPADVEAIVTDNDAGSDACAIEHRAQVGRCLGRITVERVAVDGAERVAELSELRELVLGRCER
nr:hypothetical protein [Rhodococcus sp. LW-XY12]